MRRRITVLSAITLAVLILIIHGCKKDDDKVLNMITVAGNATASYNGEYTAGEGHYNGPYDIQCVTTTYGSYLLITFSPDVAVYIEFVLSTAVTAIPEGTITPSVEECGEGFYAAFYPDYASKNGGLVLSTGTITITKSGDIYDVDLDLGFNSLSGGGTLKGNFNGTLSQMVYQ